jgi:hypothetical protein
MIKRKAKEAVGGSGAKRRSSTRLAVDGLLAPVGELQPEIPGLPAGAALLDNLSVNLRAHLSALPLIVLVRDYADWFIRNARERVSVRFACAGQEPRHMSTHGLAVGDLLLRQREYAYRQVGSRAITWGPKVGRTYATTEAANEDDRRIRAQVEAQAAQAAQDRAAKGEDRDLAADINVEDMADRECARLKLESPTEPIIDESAYGMLPKSVTQWIQDPFAFYHEALSGRGESEFYTIELDPWAHQDLLRRAAGDRAVSLSRRVCFSRISPTNGALSDDWGLVIVGPAVSDLGWQERVRLDARTPPEYLSDLDHQTQKNRPALQRAPL